MHRPPDFPGNRFLLGMTAVFAVLRNIVGDAIRCYGQRRTYDNRALVILAVAAIAAVALTEAARLHRADPLRDEKNAAVELMQLSMDAIKEEKLRIGMPIDRRVDINDTGMIGVEYTDITTTLGSLAVKRTSAQPAFAAVVVDLLDRAGVRPGDNVAVSFSGSFPALNIAVLSAAKALRLRLAVISSIGSSMYGANQPDMTWLDMERILVEKGIFSCRSIAASVGGIYDAGGGLDAAGIGLGIEAIRRNEVFLIEEEGYSTLVADVRRRMDLFDQAFDGKKPMAFINVGGSLTSLGDGAENHRIPTGLVKKLPTTVDPKRGIIFLMNERGVPVIHLLGIKSIAARYGISIDPAPFPGGATAKIRTTGKYSAPLAAASLAVIIALLLVMRNKGLPRASGGAESEPR